MIFSEIILTSQYLGQNHSNDFAVEFKVKQKELFVLMDQTIFLDIVASAWITGNSHRHRILAVSKIWIPSEKIIAALSILFPEYTFSSVALTETTSKAFMSKAKIHDGRAEILLNEIGISPSLQIPYDTDYWAEFLFTKGDASLNVSSTTALYGQELVEELKRIKKQPQINNLFKNVIH